MSYFDIKIVLIFTLMSFFIFFLEKSVFLFLAFENKQKSRK